MVHEQVIRSMRGARTAIVASLIFMLIIAGCAEPQGENAAGGGKDATTTPINGAATRASAGASPSSTPVSGQPTLPAARPNTEAATIPTATQPSTTATVDAAASDTPVANEAGDAEYTYTDTSLASAGGGGGTNHIQVINKNDGKRKIKADVQLNRVPGPRVEPSNVAVAYGSRAGCETIAIALQINLISRTATYVAPENLALAVNYECTDCYTVARAIQYTISVDDPTQVPPEVNDLLKQLDSELKEIRKASDLSIDDIEQRIDAVIEQFRALAEGLKDDRQETQDATTPGATPIADDGTATPESTEPIGSATPDATPSSDTPTPSAPETATSDAATPASTPSSETTSTP